MTSLKEHYDVQAPSAVFNVNNAIKRKKQTWAQFEDYLQMAASDGYPTTNIKTVDFMVKQATYNNMSVLDQRIQVKMFRKGTAREMATEMDNTALISQTAQIQSNKTQRPFTKSRNRYFNALDTSTGTDHSIEKPKTRFNRQL